MIGGYGGVSVDGRQYTARFSSPWRSNPDTAVGPLSYRFVEPLKKVHLALDPNDSDLTFDFDWIGVGDCYLEPHHTAWSRGRKTTDQSRYNQSGTANGWIELDGQRWDLNETEWAGSRDHSWGLYANRPPLLPDLKWLPPPEAPAVRQGMRWAAWWGAGEVSGFFSVHESEDGRQIQMNDVFGTPLEGGIDYGFDGPQKKLAAARHELEFRPGTRILSKGTWHFTDDSGGEWKQVYVPASPGWNPVTIGYGAGSWKDGGSVYTYHGVDGLVQEYDDFDFSKQPYDHKLYNGIEIKGIHNQEYLAEVTTIDPTGRETVGSAHVELFIPGRFDPYDFERPG
ncbi:MAG TPA: hypothetical protein QGF35_05940, partial [Dehalococcoidia bacterium]|nr:hypothetical protein [Dehalococcoidia bacterium]